MGTEHTRNKQACSFHARIVTVRLGKSSLILQGVKMISQNLTSLELCAGGGGQALGLEQAGFDHVGLVEIDKACCSTLRLNRLSWQVFEQDLETFDGRPFRGIDLLAGGLPCPPFSKAGKQLGTGDERNMFPAGLRLVDETRPRAIMFENVRGIFDPVFHSYREEIRSNLEKLGYWVDWKLINSSDYGVSQLRPRAIMIAIKTEFSDGFAWPEKNLTGAPAVGDLLVDLMAASGWRGATNWRLRANRIAPTIVGGSKKHGGPDLGPTRARNAWAELGVNGKSVADCEPEKDFVGMPRLTVRMVARLQGFPDDWAFSGKKTSAYRQVGNAFPPPVACAVATRLASCLSAGAHAALPDSRRSA
jgi:DNA (cytosine-5)-methyltransferase 1